MPTGHVFIATSLDGLIARPDGGLDWLEAANSAGEDHGYQAFIDGVDGIVMGRATFDVALRFELWPYDKSVLVLSRTLDPADVPSHVSNATTIVRSVSDALAVGRQRGWDRVYVDGGATIRAFFDAGAIHDMIITRIPVLLGAGLPLFGTSSGDVHLQHLETRSFPSGLVQSRYEVAL